MRDLLESPLVTTLLSRSPHPPLIARTVWRADLTPEIDKLDVSLNVRAALHLLNDDYSSAHRLAETQMGETYTDHIHCISHRREPDYPNARRAWFARRLTHPYLVDMYIQGVADASLSGAKRAVRDFINACQSAEASGEENPELERRQWEEMTSLTKLLIENGY